MKLRGDRCQCTACGEAFNSTYAFDRHRQGVYTDRRCLTPLAMLGKGFGKNSAGFWISAAKKPSAWPTAMSDFALDALIAQEHHAQAALDDIGRDLENT